MNFTSHTKSIYLKGIGHDYGNTKGPTQVVKIFGVILVILVGGLKWLTFLV
jgi:hypothetical protein